MPGEFAPPPPKVKITKKQLKQIQANYKLAGIKNKKFSEIEELEKQILEKVIDEKIDEVY